MHLSYFCNVEKFCQHIEKLLAHHDFVVVPHLGGFVVQMQSAQLLPDRITPPLATVGFNPLMHHADGLLAIEISRSEHISYRMAVEYIEKEVEAINFRLKSTNQVRLGNLGFISKNESGNLQFQPIEKVDYLPGNYGLTDVYIKARSTNSKNESGKVTIQFHPARFYKYAAAVLLFAGLFATSNRVSDVRQADTANLASLSFLKSSELAIDSVAALSTDTVDLSTIEAPASTAFGFHVIVASLGDQESADTYCKSLLNDNFSNAQVLPPVKTYRVAIQSFSDRKKAIDFMENLRKTDSRFETAWVLCN